MATDKEPSTDRQLQSFLPIQDLNLPPKPTQKPTSTHTPSKQPRNPVQKPVHSSLRDQSLSQEQRAKLERSLELTSLSTKYTQDLAIEEHPDGSSTLLINHPITDPDFAFDLPSILLEFTIPPSAAHAMKAQLLNAEIPPPILRSINAYLEHLCSIHKGKPAVKAIIAVLEANLEKLLSGTAVATASTAATASTVKIVKLPTKEPAKERYSEEALTLQSPLATPNSTLRSIVNPAVRVAPNPMPPGFTQQSFQVGCAMRNWKGIAVALLLQLDIQIKCNKCSQVNSFLGMTPGVILSENCSKCDKLISGQFFGEFIHRTSPILCFLQLKGGSPVAAGGLSNALYQVECDACEDFVYEGKLLNVFQVNQVSPGQEVRLACRKCHQKMLFCFDSGVQFREPAQLLSKAVTVKAQKIPGLVIGQPLPERGTCKHYRKSFRWLRFPCCGKVFACDTCHDEATADGHASQWATRMICGHCSREQPFSDNKCTCGGYPTDNRASSFWEGGKGTRNTATMSKKDSHKYRGQTKKAASAK